MNLVTRTRAHLRAVQAWKEGTLCTFDEAAKKVATLLGEPLLGNHLLGTKLKSTKRGRPISSSLTKRENFGLLATYYLARGASTTVAIGIAAEALPLHLDISKTHALRAISNTKKLVAGKKLAEIEMLAITAWLALGAIAVRPDSRNITRGPGPGRPRSVKNKQRREARYWPTSWG